VTSLAADAWPAQALHERLDCARGEMENRLKECQLDLFADRTSTRTMRGNQLRPWFASMAYVLLEALRRIALPATRLAQATAGTIRLKLLKLGALVRVSVRRVTVQIASDHPWQHDWAIAHDALTAAAAG
jgi:Transposase DDE domain group 1